MMSLLIVLCYSLSALALFVSIYSKTWPSTKGRMISAYIEKCDSGADYTESPNITYEYKVDSHTYQSTLIRAAGNLSWSTSIPGISSACAQVNEFINRNEITVYYCPILPRYACLKPGGFAPTAILSLTASALLAIHTR